jgi:hypothetical protein
MSASAVQTAEVVQLNSNVNSQKLSDGPRPPQHAHRQVKKCREQRENSIHSDPDNAKRKREQPNYREQHKSQERERPAENKQNAPQ